MAARLPVTLRKTHANGEQTLRELFLGATAEKASGIGDLEAALKRARKSRQTYVIVIETDPAISTADGGAWWDVPVPEASERGAVKKARAAYVAATAKQRVGE